MNAPGTIAALVVALLFAVALFAMTVGELQVAGVCFLSASLLIYLRERYLVD